MATITTIQRRTRRTIATIVTTAVVAFAIVFGTAFVGLASASAAEAAPVRWAHPVHDKRPKSPICRFLNICKTETIKWRGNPNIAYTNPKNIARLPAYSITYRY